MYTKAYINQQFFSHFDTDASCIVQSPGRINIIGEHTDYNEGFVFPAAIDKYIYIALSPREDQKVNFYSAAYQGSFESTLHRYEPEAPEWTRYILGVINLIHRKRKIEKGFNLYLDGDIPLGAGLSSSAALTCATGFALNSLFKLELSRIEIAQIGQQAEHEYVGVKCGIMDQFASVMGKENEAFVLDCKDLTYQYFNLHWPDHEILLINSNVKHNLASSAYNKRREACEQGVIWVREKYPEVNSLRDVTIEQLETLVKPKSEDIFKKCAFVVNENKRVLAASKAIQDHNITLLGKLLFETHWALSKDYEVSCEELDFLVDFTQQNPDVLGSRMMGGGFGGCTINILKKGTSSSLVEKIGPAYLERFGTAITPIQVELSSGSSLML